MRIKVRLPRVENTSPIRPEICPDDCGCQDFKKHGKESKREHMRDIQHDEAVSQRWLCLRCKWRFRNYSPGISNAQQSDRLKAMSIILYVLGLSYGGYRISWKR